MTCWPSSGSTRRVVYLSADGVRPEWERQVNPILQFHAELERAVQRSGLEWVFLHPASFVSNNLSWAPQIREGAVRAPSDRRCARWSTRLISRRSRCTR